MEDGDGNTSSISDGGKEGSIVKIKQKNAVRNARRGGNERRKLLVGNISFDDDEDSSVIAANNSVSKVNGEVEALKDEGEGDLKMPGVKSNHKRKYSCGISPKNMKDSLAISGEYKGFKKRLIVQASKSSNSPSRRFLLPKGKKALKKVDSRQISDSSQISTDGAEPSTPLTEYAQYLGLQPTVKFKCYKCHESCFPSMHKLQEHQNNCLRTYRTSGSEPLPSASIEPPPTTNFRITRKVYLCSACGTYYENWNLFLHMREVHNRHICLYCLGMFSQADKLSVHLTAKHGVREREIGTRAQFLSIFKSGCYLMCDTCEQVFTEKDEFHDHACLDLAALAADRACSLCGLRGSHFPTCRRAYAEMFSPPQINATRIVSLSSDTTIVPLPSELGIQDKSLTIAQYLIPLDKLVSGVQGEGLLIGPRAFFPSEESLEEMQDRTRDLSDLDSEYDISDAATFCHVDIEEDPAKHSPFHVYYPSDSIESMNIPDPAEIQQSFSIYTLPELQQAPCHFYETLGKEQFCRISELPQIESEQIAVSKQTSYSLEMPMLDLQAQVDGNKPKDLLSVSNSSDHHALENESPSRAIECELSENSSADDRVLNLQHQKVATKDDEKCSGMLSDKEMKDFFFEISQEGEEGGGGGDSRGGGGGGDGRGAGGGVGDGRGAGGGDGRGGGGGVGGDGGDDGGDGGDDGGDGGDDGGGGGIEGGGGGGSELVEEEKVKEIEEKKEDEERNENEYEKGETKSMGEANEGEENDEKVTESDQITAVEDDHHSPKSDKQITSDPDNGEALNDVQENSELSLNYEDATSQKDVINLMNALSKGETPESRNSPLQNDDMNQSKISNENESEEKTCHYVNVGLMGRNNASLNKDDDGVVDTRDVVNTDIGISSSAYQVVDKTDLLPVNGEERKIGSENENQLTTDLSKQPLDDEIGSNSPNNISVEEDDNPKTCTGVDDKLEMGIVEKIDEKEDLYSLKETSIADEPNIGLKTSSATEAESESESESSDSGGESHESNGSTSSSDVSSEENEEIERKLSPGKEKTIITEESDGDNADSDKLSLIVDENRSPQDTESVKENNSNYKDNLVTEEKNATGNETEKDNTVLQIEDRLNSEEAKLGTVDGEHDDSAENIQIAGDDVPVLELTLEENLEVLHSPALVKECVKISCSACVFCNHAKKIAVNGKQLVLHILAEHRFEPVVCSDSGELTAVDGFVDRLKLAVSELQDIFFNTDSYDSSDKTFSRPYDGTYECFHCNFITTLHKELYVHNRKMHQKTILLCIMCKSNFYSYSELLCHLCPGIYVPNSNITFRCCLCEVDGLPSAFRLMVHLRKRHHACDVCLEATGDQQKLSNHVWKHKLHHLCYRCGIAYRNKPDITKHLFWKHGTESVLCKKCLQKKWPHVYHFCIPPHAFVCEECNASFSRAVALRVHRRWHGREFPYGCDECDERFISRKLLAKHCNKHQQPYIGKQPDTIIDGKKNGKVDGGENKEDIRPVGDVSAEVINTNADSEDLVSANIGDVSDGITDTLLREHDTNHNENHPECVPVLAKNVPEETYCELKKNKVVDVYDLPPLNLSSDSDDSDVETTPKPLSTAQEESNSKKTNKISDDRNTDLDFKGQATEEMSCIDEEPAQILDGVWDNFKTYTAKLEQRGALQSENLDISTFKVSVNECPSNFADSAVVNVEHDYCAQLLKSADEVVEQENEGPKPQPESPVQNQDKIVLEGRDWPDDEKNTCFDVDHNYCFNTSPHQDEKDTSAASVSTPSKKRQKSPKKKQRHSGSSSSSDSSSTDSSSCSCGTNCSCSSSSSSSSGSSSSQSTDSDSSSSEGRKRQAARRERRKERARKKLELNQPDVKATAVEAPGLSLILSPVHLPPVASFSPTLPQASLSPPQSLPLSPSVSPVPPDSAVNGVSGQEDQFVNSVGEDEEIKDSDLDTDEPETDEDFYDKYPQRPVSRILTEKRNQLHLLAQAAPVGNGMVAQPNPPNVPESLESVPKKKVKSKKHKKSHQHVNMDKRAENKLKLNIPPSYYNSPSRFSIVSPTRSVSPLMNPSNLGTPGQLPRLPLELYSAQAVEPSASITYHSTGSGSDTDSRRSSKRKRVPKKFYGDSSDEDGDHSSVQPYKWRKVGPGSGGSLLSAAQTITPSSNYFKNNSVAIADTIRVLDKSEDEGGDESDSGREVKRSTSDSSNSDSDVEKEQDEELSDGDSDAEAASFTQISSVPSGSSDTIQQQRNENLYCYCQCPYDEVSEMIACDGKECTIEWFHFECVGIMVPPKGKWFCPDCRKKSAGRGEYLDNS